MTKRQPILDELHAVREKLLADSGGTLAGLVARLQAEQAKSGRIILKTTRSAGPSKSNEVAVETSASLSFPGSPAERGNEG